MKSNYSKYWDIEVPKIKELVKQGVSIVEISKSYPVTFQRLSQICQEYGFSIRDVGLERRDTIRQTRLQQIIEDRKIAKELKKQKWLKKWSDLTNYKFKKLDMSRSFKASTKNVDPKVIRAREITRSYVERNRLKVLCRHICDTAINRGYITKGICSCTSIDVEAHHDDYKFPFQINWVCKKCHGEIHTGTKRDFKNINRKTRSDKGIKRPLKYECPACELNRKLGFGPQPNCRVVVAKE